MDEEEELINWEMIAAKSAGESAKRVVRLVKLEAPDNVLLSELALFHKRVSWIMTYASAYLNKEKDNATENDE